MGCRWVWLLGALIGCGDGTAPPRAEPPPPWDDDSDRLGHCAFTPAPEREALPARAPSPLRAGYGSAVLEIPIGTPLGAYGARVHALGMADDPDARHPRFATAMSVSVGMHDSARAEALALEAGALPLLIMRVDAPFITENVVFALERALAPDGTLRGRILLSASHSHAAWGGWIPTIHLAPGADRPSEALFERAIAALEAAGRAALDSLEPARMGIAIEPAFDPGDDVTRDRRHENDALLGPDGNDAGKDKDRQVWALRIDRMSGEPLVALVDVPIHGTVGDAANPLMSTDAPGGVARGMASALGYPVMHLQGAAGDLSPGADGGRGHCPDALRCHDMPRLERLGARAAQQLAPLVRDIETSDEVALEIATRTFAVGRAGVVTRPDGHELYYLPPDRDAYPDGVLFDEDGRAASPFDEFNTLAGAGLCGESEGITFAPIPGSSGLGPYHACIDLDTGALTILSLFEMDVPLLPICDSVRSTGAALRISGMPGGDVLLIGVPGEPTAPYAQYLRGRSPAGAERTLIVGYANEYSGYMLTAEDWLSGGYECSTNIWGPREGEQILEELVHLSELAWTPEIEDSELGSDRFEDFVFPPGDAVAAIQSDDHGTPVPSDAALWWPDTTATVSAQPEATVARAVGVARFAWHGGDPAIDYPTVTVEREAAPDVWEPLYGADGRLASSHDGVVVVTYTPVPLDSASPSSHRYAASWQPTGVEPLLLDEPLRPYALPLGNHRLCASGKALGASGMTAYALCSAPFEVVAAPPSDQATAARQSDHIALAVTLGPAPGLRALRDGVSDGLLPLPGPWSVVVTLDDQSELSMDITPDPEGTAIVPLGPGPLGAAVSLTVLDPLGNGGTLLVQ